MTLDVKSNIFVLLEALEVESIPGHKKHECYCCRKADIIAQLKSFIVQRKELEEESPYPEGS